MVSTASRDPWYPPFRDSASGATCSRFRLGECLVYTGFRLIWAARKHNTLRLACCLIIVLWQSLPLSGFLCSRGAYPFTNHHSTLFIAFSPGIGKRPIANGVNTVFNDGHRPASGTYGPGTVLVCRPSLTSLLEKPPRCPGVTPMLIP